MQKFFASRIWLLRYALFLWRNNGPLQKGSWMQIARRAFLMRYCLLHKQETQIDNGHRSIIVQTLKCLYKYNCGFCSRFDQNTTKALLKTISLKELFKIAKGIFTQTSGIIRKILVNLFHQKLYY